MEYSKKNLTLFYGGVKFNQGFHGTHIQARTTNSALKEKLNVFTSINPAQNDSAQNDLFNADCYTQSRMINLVENS